MPYLFGSHTSVPNKEEPMPDREQVDRLERRIAELEAQARMHGEALKLVHDSLREVPRQPPRPAPPLVVRY
jgi:hypothetical protein